LERRTHSEIIFDVNQVVYLPSAYNAILAKPPINKLGAVVSTALLATKIPTPHGNVFFYFPFGGGIRKGKDIAI